MMAVTVSMPPPPQPAKKRKASIDIIVGARAQPAVETWREMGRERGASADLARAPSEVREKGRRVGTAR